jgi:hypothetical protein
MTTRNKPSSGTGTEIDFDLSHYTLDDLYKLFQLNSNEPLNSTTLKKAKRIVVMSHPDKSRLPPHYFTFFSKAYGLLSEMEGITSNIKKREHGTTYVDDINTYSNEIHNTIKETHTNTNASNKRTVIMKEFNARFEEINRDMLPQNDPHGYSEWFKQDLPEENLQNHDALYAKRKQELREKYALTTNKIQSSPLGNLSAGSSLLDQTDDFTSGLFDSMQYTDLKKSYTETIIPVGEEDFQRMPTYRTVDEYQAARNIDTRDTKALYHEHERMLSTREEEERKMSDYRAYELARQLEDSEAKNKMFASQFYKILN